MGRFIKRAGLCVSVTVLMLQVACAPTPEPRLKIGEAYAIDGTTYRPQIQPDYKEVGYASWYGSAFHRKMTANGEVFNKNEFTAAHKTLPLPSIVKVTNLSNGRSIRVRVNDRGPFVRGRIIDMSENAAAALGFKGRGTAKVMVELDREASLALLKDPRLRMKEAEKKLVMKAYQEYDMPSSNPLHTSQPLVAQETPPLTDMPQLGRGITKQVKQENQMQQKYQQVAAVTEEPVEQSARKQAQKTISKKQQQLAQRSLKAQKISKQKQIPQEQPQQLTQEQMQEVEPQSAETQEPQDQAEEVEQVQEQPIQQPVTQKRQPLAVQVAEAQNNQANKLPLSQQKAHNRNKELLEELGETPATQQLTQEPGQQIVSKQPQKKVAQAKQQVQQDQEQAENENQEEQPAENQQAQQEVKQPQILSKVQKQKPGQKLQQASQVTSSRTQAVRTAASSTSSLTQNTQTPPTATSDNIAGSGLKIQVASATSRADAEKIRTRLENFSSKIQEADVNGKRYFRVQLAGLASADDAEDKLTHVKSIGFKDAFILKSTK